MLPRRLLAASALEFAAKTHPRKQPQKLLRRDFDEEDLPLLDAWNGLSGPEQATAVQLSFPRFRNLTFDDATGEFKSIEVSE